MEKINYILSHILLLGVHCFNRNLLKQLAAIFFFFFLFGEKQACLRSMPIFSDFKVILVFCIFLKLETCKSESNLQFSKYVGSPTMYIIVETARIPS